MKPNLPLAIVSLGFFTSSLCSATTIFEDDFEGFSGGGFDGNGFSSVGFASGTAITGVTAVIAGDGWNGLSGGQNQVEIADASMTTHLKAFTTGVSVDLNQNGLRYEFTLVEFTNLKLSLDFGSADGSPQGIYWKIDGDDSLDGTSSPTPIGTTDSFSTNFALAAGTYTLSLGSDTVTSLSGTHVDNIKLESVPEPSSTFLLALGTVGLLFRRGNRR